jgi:hypothetical protein
MLSDAEAGNVKNKDWVMDFSLTSEQQELVDAASRFAKECLAPSYRLPRAGQSSRPRRSPPRLMFNRIASELNFSNPLSARLSAFYAA